MITAKTLDIARKIYKPSHKQMEWVGKIVSLLVNKGIKSVTFQKPFKVGGLTCVGIELEDTPTWCLIKWKPNFEISTTTDPCCSAFILKVSELNKIYKNIEKIL